MIRLTPALLIFSTCASFCYRRIAFMLSRRTIRILAYSGNSSLPIHHGNYNLLGFFYVFYQPLRSKDIYHIFNIAKPVRRLIKPPSYRGGRFDTPLLTYSYFLSNLQERNIISNFSDCLQCRTAIFNGIVQSATIVSSRIPRLKSILAILVGCSA